MPKCWFAKQVHGATNMLSNSSCEDIEITTDHACMLMPNQKNNIVGKQQSMVIVTQIREVISMTKRAL